MHKTGNLIGCRDCRKSQDEMLRFCMFVVFVNNTAACTSKRRPHAAFRSPEPENFRGNFTSASAALRRLHESHTDAFYFNNYNQDVLLIKYYNPI